MLVAPLKGEKRGSGPGEPDKRQPKCDEPGRRNRLRRQPLRHVYAEDRGYKPAPVSGVQAKSGRSMNGHFSTKFLWVERLAHYVAPR
jgi:hypothetical protein